MDREDENPGALELARSGYAVRDPRRPTIDQRQFGGALARAHLDRDRARRTGASPAYDEPSPEGALPAVGRGALAVLSGPRRLQELASDLPQMVDRNASAVVEGMAPSYAHEMIARARAARERGDWPAWFTYGLMTAPAAGADVANVVGAGVGLRQLGRGAAYLGGQALERGPEMTGALQRLFGSRVGAGAAANTAGFTAGEPIGNMLSDGPEQR